jgi:hypothetical protein
MKKLFAVVTISAFMFACNNIETKTETVSSDSSRTDSAAHNVLDTTKKMVNEAKVLVDSAKSKMEKALDNVKGNPDTLKN